MALFSIFDIAGSAMAAQSQRLNVSASNMANADSVAGPDGQPYRARQVMFTLDAAAGSEIGGVKVSEVVESSAPARLVYEPGHPLADEQGYVRMPSQCGARNGQHALGLTQLSGQRGSDERCEVSDVENPHPRSVRIVDHDS